MNSHSESEDCKFQESESEEIDVWEPVPTKAGNSDIQLPQDYIAVHTIGAEDIETWITVNQELMRQEITRRLMKLYTISFLVGLVVFTFTQNTWLLAALLLPVLIRWIVEYYFRRPKK